MFTPQRRGWSGWSPLSGERRDKGKVLATSEAAVAKDVNDFSPVKGWITTFEENGGFFGQSEPEVWRRFKEAGTLEEGSIEKKDRASLLVHLSNLESELYDYQYNMGLLLMERKEWGTKTEKLKASAQDAEENLRRELAAHLIAVSEAEKREENVKKALAVERQCVIDLERALKEMRADAAELKVSAENKLVHARELVAGTAEKGLLADSKLHEADALQAEAVRKHGIAERKLQEAEAREDALRRERLAFKAQQEAYEAELARHRQSLLEWESKLQEGQERLLEGQKILNQREDAMNKKESALKKIEIDVLAEKKRTESEYLLLHQSEADLGAKVSDLAVREEAAIAKEITMVKKERELLLLQERVASRERVLEQHELHVKDTEAFVSRERVRVEAFATTLRTKEAALPQQQRDLIDLQRSIDEQKAEVEAKCAEYEILLAELERKRTVFEDENDRLSQRKTALEQLENDCVIREEKLSKRELSLEKKTEKQKEKEKDLEMKSKGLKERERALKAEEKQMEADRKSLAEEVENAKEVMLENENSRLSLELEWQRLRQEQDRLRVTDQEREDLLKLQKCLKQEIDDCRAQKKLMAMEAGGLKKEKEKFEKDWDILDEKRELVKKELEKADQEAQRVSEWLCVEEGRLKEEKRLLRDQIRSESEALRLEKEAFTSRVEHERGEWFSSVEKEREDLVRDMESRKRELERSIEKRKEDAEKLSRERELRMKRELERANEKIVAQSLLAERKMEDVNVEKLKLDKVKQEIIKLREDSEKEWMEIKKDIEELKIQREKLKEQREGLIKEREEIIREGESLKKLREELNVGECSLQSKLSTPPSSEIGKAMPNANLQASTLPQEKSADDDIHLTPSLRTTNSLDKSFETPGRLSWLHRCVSGLFVSPEKKNEEFTFKGATKQLEESKVFNKDAIEGNQVSSGSIVQSAEKGTKNRRQSVRRTHSIRAVMEDAKAILEQSEENAKQTSSSLGDDERSEYLEGKKKNLAAPSASETDKDTRASRHTRKRIHTQANETVSDTETEDTEVESDVMTAGRRKRQQRDSSLTGEMEKETPGLKRYNFRRSTITKMGAPKGSNDVKEKATAGLDKEGELTNQEDPSSVNAEGVTVDDHAHTGVVDTDGGNIEVVLHEQVKVYVRQTKISLVEDEGHAEKYVQVGEDECEEDGAEEEGLAEDGEDSGDNVESQEDGEDIGNEEEDEESKKRSLTQKWWDYMIT
ncbi:hypothetical protein L7F22_050986 [Adiantum nelumboides]|nr:hypothetical protein [Adiantum nelumboides]